jgi:hypothetical protein
MIKSVAPPDFPAVRAVRLVDSFMLAFLLLAKQAMAAKHVLRAGRQRTMAFRQQ